MLSGNVTLRPGVIAEAAAFTATFEDEAFMTLLLMISDTRKRVAILTLLSFLAMC